MIAHKSGRDGLSRRRGLRGVALAGTGALALAGFAGMAQVTGSAFADETVNLTLANAPTKLLDGTPINVKSVRVINDDTSPLPTDLGCFSITPGKTVATGQKISVRDHLTGNFFAAENCGEPIPNSVALVIAETTTDEFVFDLTKNLNDGRG